MRVMRPFAVLVALFLLLAQAQPAAAQHGGPGISSLLTCERPNVTPPRCTSVGDNFRHYVFFDPSLTEELRSSLRDTMAEDYDPTALIVREHPALTSQTDVIAFSANYGENGAAGWVYCPSDAPQGTNAQGDRWCRHQELHFNLNPRYAIYLNDDGSRDYVACHELGHTVGLRHWGNPPESSGPVGATCMNADTPDGPTDLSQAEIDHINAYPYAVRVRARNFEERAFGDPLPKAISSWPASGVGALEVEHYATLDELAAAADAVIHGRVAGVAAGRAFGDPGGYQLHYAAVTVEINEVLGGRVGSTQVVLEVPLWNGAASLADVERTAPDGDVILFLRAKTDGPYYRLVSMDALVVDDRGGSAVPVGAAALAELAGMSFADSARAVAVASEVAAAGTQAPPPLHFDGGDGDGIYDFYLKLRRA